MDISELVQCEGQVACMSAVKLVVGGGGGSFFAMALAILRRTSSWHSLYLHWSKASSQLFKGWSRVPLSPHRGQHSLSFFSRWFALCGSVSTPAFNSNLICSAERNCKDFYHTLAPSGMSVSHHLPLLLKALQLMRHLPAV